MATVLSSAPPSTRTAGSGLELTLAGAGLTAGGSGLAYGLVAIVV